MYHPRNHPASVAQVRLCMWTSHVAVLFEAIPSWGTMLDAGVQHKGATTLSDSS